jgi:hypothetical protein
MWCRKSATARGGGGCKQLVSTLARRLRAGVERGAGVVRSGGACRQLHHSGLGPWQKPARSAGHLAAIWAVLCRLHGKDGCEH